MMMNYNYKQLVEDFCDSQSTPAKKKDCRVKIFKPEFYNLDLYNCKPSELSECILNLVSKSFKIEYLKSIRKIMSDFYNFSIAKGYTNINPFDNYIQLEYDYLANTMVYRSNIKFIYYEDINLICSYVSRIHVKSGLYLNFFIAALYNGYSQQDFMKMKMDNVFSHNCWKEDLFKFYANEYINALENGEQYKDYVLKINININSEMDEKSFKKYQTDACARFFTKYITKKIDNYFDEKCLIKPNTILYSGFLSYCRTKCKTNKEFVSLFEKTPGYKHTESIERLMRYANEFFVDKTKVNTPAKISKLKDVLFVLIRKSIWYLDQYN
jgi:hypothetical protein